MRATRGPATVATLAFLLTLTFAAVTPPTSAQGEGPTTNPTVVYRQTSGSYEDSTTPATNAAVDDVSLGPNKDDAIYIGHERPFDQASLRTTTARDGGSVVWEYRAQGSWAELVPSDATDGLGLEGTFTIAWNPPTFWTRTQLDEANAPGAYYYIRLRVVDRLAGVPRIAQVAIEAWEEPAKIWQYSSQAWGEPPAPVEADYNDVSLVPGFALAVAGDGSVMRSPDGGDRWARVASFDADLRGVDVFNATHAVVVGSGGGVWRTSDSGTTWTRLSTSATFLLEKVAWVTPQLIVAVGNSGVIRSTNGGSSWVRDSPTEHLFDVSFPSATHGWIVGDTLDQDVVYKTSNGGVTWDRVNIPIPSVQRPKAVHFRTATFGWVAGDQFVVRTTDGGANWQPFVTTNYYKDINFHDDANGWIVGDKVVQRILNADSDAGVVRFDTRNDDVYYSRSIAIRSAETVVAVGASGLILRSTDIGSTWTRPGDWGASDLRALDRLSSGVLWAVGAQGSILRSGDRGRNWTGYESLGAGTLYDVDFVDDEHGWVVGETGAVHATRDGGATWESKQLGVAHLYAVHMASAQRGWVVGDLGAGYETSDGGATWTEMAMPDPIPLRDVAATSERVFAAGAGTVYRRAAGGGTWEEIAVNGATDLRSLRFGDNARGWASDANGKIFGTNNGGTEWERQPTSPQLPLYGVDSVGPEFAWTLGEGGNLHRTNNGGKIWVLFGTRVTSALYDVSGDPAGPSAAVGALAVIRSTGPQWADATAANAPLYPHVLPQSSLSEGDMIHIGQSQPFDSIIVKVELTGPGSQVRWEYSAGDEWKALTGDDGTSNFGYLGLGTIRFVLPADWKAQPLPADPMPRYWVRARILVPSHIGAVGLNEIGTLRLAQPLEVGPPIVSPTISTAPTASTAAGGFAMTASPSEIDLGRLPRGAQATADLNLLAFRGSAAAELELDGPAASWIRPSASRFQLREGVNQTVRLEVFVPEDAPPGPTTARVYVEAFPTGPLTSLTGWVDLRLIVDAADLVQVRYLRDPSRWSAEFSNYLANTLALTFEATLTQVGGGASVSGSSTLDIASGTRANATGALDVADLPSGPYDLRVTARHGNESDSRVVRVFLGASPVAVGSLEVSVQPFEDVLVTFTMTNTATVGLVARPVVTIYDAGDVPIAFIRGNAMSLQPDETRAVAIPWEPIFGVYRAAVHAEVDNAEPSDALEQPFAVRGSPTEGPTVWERHGVLFMVLFVLIANVAAGLGLWTGRRA